MKKNRSCFEQVKRKLRSRIFNGFWFWRKSAWENRVCNFRGVGDKNGVANVWLFLIMIFNQKVEIDSDRVHFCLDTKTNQKSQVCLNLCS